MATARVQVVFQGATNLAEDRFINTFHFHDESVFWSTTYAQDVAFMSAQFFLDGTESTPLGNLLSPFVNRIFSTNVYDMQQPEGEREPTTIDDWTLPTVSNDTGLPEEVAVCVTLTGASPVTPRRRGRLYIGPLANLSDVVETGDNAEPARVKMTGTSCIANKLAYAANRLRQKLDGDATWCIRSVTPSENYVPIVGGWIDNAFDIQRRRGPDPTARLLWPIP